MVCLSGGVRTSSIEMVRPDWRRSGTERLDPVEARGDGALRVASRQFLDDDPDGRVPLADHVVHVVEPAGSASLKNRRPADDSTWKSPSSLA